MKNIAEKLAGYQGIISRWCSLTGHVVDRTKSEDAEADELAHFERHLDDLRERRDFDRLRPSDKDVWKFD